MNPVTAENLGPVPQSEQEALEAILRIHRRDIMWHFDDDPADVIDLPTRQPVFTPDGVVRANEIVNELFAFLDDPFDFVVWLQKNTDGSVAQYLAHVEQEREAL